MVRKNAVGDLKGFGDLAKVLSRNPLGIIALFIVLIYALACFATAFASWFTPAQKTLLVCFLVVFPVLVLGVFAWLVSSGNIFGPGDYIHEENYVRPRLLAAVSLALASSKGDSSQSEIRKIVEAILLVRPADTTSSSDWGNRVLWVDDRPENNVNERPAFEAVGLACSLVLSTREALERLSKEKYAAIISDMGRREGPREGYVLLDSIRQKGDGTPFFIYASSKAPAHKREAAEHGGQGSTNNPQELFQMVAKAVLNPSRSETRL